MPLELLLILVSTGIGAIAIVLHLTGHSTARRMDKKSAAQAWLRQFPDQEIHHILLAQNGLAALVKSRDPAAPIGLVWAFGADSVARHLDHSSVEPFAEGLRLTLSDFTAPQVALRLSAAEIETWTKLIETPPPPPLSTRAHP